MFLPRTPHFPAATLGLTLVLAGAVLQMAGLAYDARSHAGGHDGGAHEAVFTLSNPGHVLLGVGLAAVVAGVLLALLARRAERSERRRSIMRMVLPGSTAIALTVLAFGTFAVVLHSGQVTLGTEAPAAASTHAHNASTVQWPSGREGALLDEQLARARASTAKYVSIEAARQDGFVPLTPDVPGIGMHMINPARVDDVFTPEEPEILLYTWTGYQWKYLGIMYIGEESAGIVPPPEGFAGEADVWHFHDGTCGLGGLDIPMDDRLSAAECITLGGSYHGTKGPWGVHVWVATPNPRGIFAHDHPLAAGLGGLHVSAGFGDEAR